MRRTLFLLSIVGALWAHSASASAQARGPRLHAGVGFALNFGGEVDVESGGIDIDRDLDPTIGLRGHLDYAVHRHVSIGGLARFSWWHPDSYFGQDRSFLFDLGPRVIGHFDWRAFRFYSGLSLGLTISALNHDWGRLLDNPGFGPTLSLTVAGAEWWFARRTGLFAELGWVGHWFSHDYLPNGEADFRLSQGLFEFGLVFGS